MDGVYVIFILTVHHLSFFLYFYILEELYLMLHIFIILILVFWKYYLLLLNGNSIYGLCFTDWTNELWGVTVITNLLSPIPSLIEWLCGGHYVYNPTLKRSFVFHFLFPFLLCGFLLYHIFNLHFLSSSYPNRNSTNNKIACFLSLLVKISMERY